MSKSRPEAEPDADDLCALLEEGLQDAAAFERGELELPVLQPSDDYAERVRAMRKSLGYRSRAAFAADFGIPAKTLQNWEQARTIPDPAARAFLRVIAADPEGVKRILAKTS